MPTKSDLWQMFEPVARELGLQLFEMEIPNSRSRVLRVYLTRDRNADSAGDPIQIEADVSVGEDAPVRKGVTLDDCALFSKRLSRLEGFDDLFHDQWTLEVSSPGINRRLTRPDHFDGAVGERVKVKYRGDGSSNVVSKGMLSTFDGKTLTIEDEDKGAPTTVDYTQVVEARVDFLFTRER